MQRFWCGYYVCKLIGDNIIVLLNQCRKKDVVLYAMHRTDTDTTVEIAKSQYEALLVQAMKLNVEVVLQQKRGLPYFLAKMKHKYLLCLGIILCTICLIYQNNAIWTVLVDGENILSEAEIMLELEQMGIHPGVLKMQFSTKEIEATLRQRIQALQWVSCKVNGTRLEILIREAYQFQREDLDQGNPDGNIYAPENGYVRGLVVRNGTAKVKVGDYVNAGDMLIGQEILPVTGAEFLPDAGRHKAQGDILLEEEISGTFYVDTYAHLWVRPKWWNQDSWLLQKQKKRDALLELESMEKINEFLEIYRKKGIQILQKNVKILRTINKWEIQITISVFERVRPDNEPGANYSQNGAYNR